MSIQELAYAGLEQAINHYLGLDPKARAGLAALHGSVIAFELVGLGITLYLVPGPNGIQLYPSHEGEPDCVLRGTPMALARMSDARESSDQLFAGTVEIRGDTELAHRFGKILGSMDIDWEEQLSRYTGDIIAHETGNLVRGFTQWGKRSVETLGMDLQEYLQEELRLLPVKAEIESFNAAVDRVRDGIERVEARIQRLLLQQEQNNPKGESQ
jgi:ubiquinone biosynthesis protein UbiJ